MTGGDEIEEVEWMLVLLPEDLLLMLLLTLFGRVTGIETSRIGTPGSLLLLLLGPEEAVLLLLLLLMEELFDADTAGGGAKDGVEQDDTGAGVPTPVAEED